MQHEKIAFRHDDPVLVAHLRRSVSYQLEEAFAARRDVRAVLDVLRRPEPTGRREVPLVEQSVERLQHERFVLLFSRRWHVFLHARVSRCKPLTVAVRLASRAPRTLRARTRFRRCPSRPRTLQSTAPTSDRLAMGLPRS